uniref:Uncharacterized protein n=1 Tax=Arundo donax TaxID=35708 RepID=A0A0A9G1K3_ARUDO
MPSENLSKFTCIVNGWASSAFLLVNSHRDPSSALTEVAPPWSATSS